MNENMKIATRIHCFLVACVTAIVCQTRVFSIHLLIEECVRIVEIKDTGLTVNDALRTVILIELKTAAWNVNVI
jgi:hypothetical protein